MLPVYNICVAFLTQWIDIEAVICVQQPAAININKGDPAGGGDPAAQKSACCG